MDLTFPEDHSSPIVTYTRIVLVGKTGTGKSATGNTILRQKAFESVISSSSVTNKSKSERGHFNDRTVSVIDTPGMCDTTLTDAQLKHEIERCIKLSVPGPHVFLLVIRLDCRFTNEEKNAINWIKDNFGEDASKCTIVLFTRGDMLGEESVERFVDRSPDLTKVLRDSQRRYVVFDNTHMENRTQVADLLDMIDKMVMINGRHYTSSIYEEAQRKMRNNEWWSKCSDSLDRASPFLATGVAVLPFNKAVTFPAGLALAGAAKALSNWMKPKTNEN